VITCRAPGRVNLIGSHTDGQEGFVLPVAMALEVTVAGEAGGDRVRLSSDGFDGVVDVAADGSDGPAGGVHGWGRYVAGVVWALAEEGRPPVGLTGSITSTVPPGAGLSSSAALEVAVAKALSASAGWEPEPLALAAACRRAEREGAGVPCGIMDQAIAVLGSPGGARLIDCRTLEHRLVPLPASHRVVVVDAGPARRLESSPFAIRAGEVAEAAARLGVRSLRDATVDMVETLPDPLRRRARHVVTENQRVLDVVAALEAGDFGAVGEAFAASHRSDVEDWEAGHPDVDRVVDLLVAHGPVAGARMTGGGFGGCVVALVDAEGVDTVLSAVAPRRSWVVPA
jgi:galactokinase